MGMAAVVKSFGCRPSPELAARTGAGVRKSPVKEPAGGGAVNEPRMLWGFGHAVDWECCRFSCGNPWLGTVCIRPMGFRRLAQP